MIPTFAVPLTRGTVLFKSSAFVEKSDKIQKKLIAAFGSLKLFSTFAAQNSSAGVAQLARAADL